MRLWQGFSQIITSVGRAFRVSLNDAAPPIDNAQSDAGVTVTHDKALALSVVWACVDLISGVLATLPWSIRERDASNKTRFAVTHPVYDLLANAPNANMTSVSWWRMMVAGVLLWGNGYARKVYLGDRIVALDPLLPQFVTPKLNDRGLLVWAYDDGRVRYELGPNEVLHLKGFTLDGLVGLSPLSYARNSLGRAMAVEQAAGATFKNNLAPGLVFKMGDRVLKPEQRTAFRDQLKSFTGAANAGRPFVLEAGMDVDKITMNPHDAEMLGSLAFTIEDLCRWFYRTPPQLIGQTDKASSWASSLENLILGWLTFGLRTLVTGIEKECNRSLLTAVERQTLYTKCAIDGLLRADAKGRAALYSIFVQNGITSRNEIRELEDLDRRDGADELTVQSNMTTLQSLGNARDEEQLKTAFRAWLGVAVPNLQIPEEDPA